MDEMENAVKRIYAPFTDREISRKMAEMLTPAGTRAEVEIVYQSIDGLHEPSRRVRATGISLATILLRVETALSTRLL